jgi:hypothetical protein
VRAWGGLRAGADRTPGRGSSARSPHGGPPAGGAGAGVYEAADGSFELAFSVVGADAELVTGAAVDVSTRTTLGDVEARFGAGTRSTAGTAKQEAELL